MTRAIALIAALQAILPNTNIMHQNTLIIPRSRDIDTSANLEEWNLSVKSDRWLKQTLDLRSCFRETHLHEGFQRRLISKDGNFICSLGFSRRRLDRRHVYCFHWTWHGVQWLASNAHLHWFRSHCTSFCKCKLLQLFEETAKFASCSFSSLQIAPPSNKDVCRLIAVQRFPN